VIERVSKDQEERGVEEKTHGVLNET